MLGTTFGVATLTSSILLRRKCSLDNAFWSQQNVINDRLCKRIENYRFEK